MSAFLRKNPESWPEAQDPVAGLDRIRWSRFCADLGTGGILVPASRGGAGLGLREAAAVIDVLGGRVSTLPYLSAAVLGVAVLNRIGDEELLEGVMTGNLVVATALPDDHQPEGDCVGAAGTGAGWRVSGQARQVMDLPRATHLAITGTVASGTPAVFLVSLAGEGAAQTDLPTMDQTRPVGDIDLAGACARLVAEGDAAAQLVREVRATAAASFAVECMGGVRALLDLTVGYANQRTQFGSRIGAFQAIKHLCADMFVLLDTSEAAVETMLRDHDSGADARFEESAFVAFLHCSQAYLQAAKASIQIHGGIGFTWEHPAHRHLKRARATTWALGSPSALEDRLLRLSGLTW